MKVVQVRIRKPADHRVEEDHEEVAIHRRKGQSQ